MKKTFNKLISYFCLLAIIFSFSACSQFIDIDDVRNGDYEQVSVTIPLQKQMIFCDTGETLSQSEPVSVEFGVNTSATYLSSAEAAAKVMRSVVQITVKTSDTIASASGVIVDIKAGKNYDPYYDGYFVMTCHHVIDSGGEITISVPDENWKNKGDIGYDERYEFVGDIGKGKIDDMFNAVSLVGGDKYGDIAILKLKVGNKIARNKIQMASFPNPNTIDVKYAEEVFAIGNPMGRLPMSYMHGYISYLERLATFDSVGIMTNLIQHDCAITHGNSGGGLFNMKGQLIGITNGGISSQPGLSYAIPYYESSEYGFMKIAEQLIKTNNAVNYGYVQGRWELGVVVSDAESKVAGTSLTIKEVAPNSNAFGKLQKGDYITKIEFLGEPYEIDSGESFVNAIFLAREVLTVSSTPSEITFIVQRAK